MTEHNANWLINAVLRYPSDWSPNVAADARDFIVNTTVGQALITRLVERMSGSLLLAMEATADGREDEALQNLIIATHARESLLGLTEIVSISIEENHE